MKIKEKIHDKYCEMLYKFHEISSINNSAAIIHQQTFLPYKNIMDGKSLVVCGAGPTLQKYQPIEGAYHIALNKAFLYDKVKFDFLFSQDFDGIKTVQQELINYRPDTCVKFFGHQNGTHKEIPETLAIKCKAKRFYTDIAATLNGYRSKFVYDIDARPIGNLPNVGLSSLQFALYMHPAVLYIVGCDMSGAHFSDKNMSKKEVKAEEKELNSHWKSDQEKLINKWLELKQFAEIHYPDTKIISVNPIGLKGIFEDLYQEK
jgi:hypothetical protein